MPTWTFVSTYLNFHRKPPHSLRSLHSRTWGIFWYGYSSDCLNKSDLINFTFMWPRIVTNFFIIKPTRCTNFTNLFWHETLHVSECSCVHHQEFIHCTLSNGMSYRFVDSFRTGPGWNCSSILVLLESCMTYTIAECTVNKLLMMDRRTVRNM